MKQTIFILIVVLFAAFGCDRAVYEKPKNLVKEKQMIQMLVDIHLAEAVFNTRRHSDSLLNNTTSEDFYYSVLGKYEVPDSVFEKSFVYYASNPKNFEKMYREVMNRLNEMEQEYSGRKNEELEFEDKK
jgi:hypothetical protein